MDALGFVVGVFSALVAAAAEGLWWGEWGEFVAGLGEGIKEVDVEENDDEEDDEDDEEEEDEDEEDNEDNEGEGEGEGAAAAAGVDEEGGVIARV